MTTPPPPGVYYDVPADEYFAWDALSSSALKGGTPADIHKRRYGSIPTTADMQWGNGAHTLLLAPEGESLKVCDFATGAAATTIAKAQAKCEPGEVAVSKFWIPQYADVLRMIRTKKPLHREYLRRIRNRDRCDVEVSIVWHETFIVNGEPHTVVCKARIDVILWVDERGGAIEAVIDLKTTKEADLNEWEARTVPRQKHHWQAPLYLRGLRQVGLKGVDGLPEWLWWVVQRPTDRVRAEAMLYRLGLDYFYMGYREVMQVMGRYATEHAKNERNGSSDWTGLTDQIVECEPPHWMMKRFEQEHLDADPVGLLASW